MKIFSPINILLLIILIITFIFPLNSVNASNEFSASYKIKYFLYENGLVEVKQNITLTNLTSEYRPESYTLKLKSLNISDVSGEDKKGQLTIDLTKAAGETIIKTKFNDIIAGKNKTLDFSLSYLTPDYLKRNGQVWEVYLPGLPNDENMTSYEITIDVPEIFSPPLYFSPPDLNNDLIWTKNELNNSGIFGIFGEYQLFDFYLKYRLQNTGINPVYTEIALPPDTAYQQVIYKNIEPKPNNVYFDNDGNYLASFYLEPSEQKTVKTYGQAKIFAAPTEKKLLSSGERKKYLQPKKYWEVNDPLIQKTALSFSDPKAIYDYVSSNLSYDYQKINQDNVIRLGAKKTLLNKDKAICMEFTDLFIALSRASGIPAREINGYAYTANPKLQPLSLNKDILHAWPEYYDDKAGFWVAVDPTWGNTTNGLDYFSKFDLNHFAFVIKGTNSEYPIPAGAYKKNAYESKDIEITLAEKELKPSRNIINVNLKGPNSTNSGFKFFITITITNLSGQSIKGENFSLNLHNLILLNKINNRFESLPPFGHQQIVLELISPSYLYKGVGKINLLLANSENSKEILLSPFYYDKMFQLILGGVIVVFIFAFVFAGKIRSILFQKSKK